jgi:hypothetical protein
MHRSSTLGALTTHAMAISPWHSSTQAVHVSGACLAAIGNCLTVHPHPPLYEGMVRVRRKVRLGYGKNSPSASSRCLSLSVSLSRCSAKPYPLVTQNLARRWPSADIGCGMKVEELSWLAAEFQAKGQRTAERTTDRAADACINQALLAAASTTPARTEDTARAEAAQPSKALGTTDSCGWRSRFHAPLALLCEIACADCTEGACSPMTARPP